MCAATSCPKLRREAYVGSRLNEQLDDQARRFVNDPARNRLETEGQPRVSQIFEWFREDFVTSAGAIGPFIARYVNDGSAVEELAKRGNDFGFLDYDWTLNAANGQRPG